MRNRGEFWAPVRDWTNASFDLDGRRVRFGLLSQAHIVSGDIGAFLSWRGIAPLGPRDVAVFDTYALRIAPDRVLYVSDFAEPIDQGWLEPGFAVADMTDGLVFCEVSGPRALELLQQGTGYDLTATDLRPSESCNILFAGLRVAIVRRDEGWRLHVERSYATALWSWFEDANSACRRVRANP